MSKLPSAIADYMRKLDKHKALPPPPAPDLAGFGSFAQVHDELVFDVEAGLDIPSAQKYPLAMTGASLDAAATTLGVQRKPSETDEALRLRMRLSMIRSQSNKAIEDMFAKELMRPFVPLDLGVPYDLFTNAPAKKPAWANASAGDILDDLKFLADKYSHLPLPIQDIPRTDKKAARARELGWTSIPDPRPRYHYGDPLFLMDPPRVENKGERDRKLWREMTEKCQVKGPIPIKFALIPAWGGWRIQMHMRVPDTTKSDAPMIDLFRTVAMPREWYGEDHARRFLLEEAKWMFRHECEENFHVGTERPFIPHHEH